LEDAGLRAACRDAPERCQALWVRGGP